MKKILFVVLGSLSLMACGPSKDKMQRLVKENLELTVDNPEKLSVITISQPDSAFGTGYFTREEVKGMVGNMQAVTDTIMRRTDNMRHFNPNDRYVIGLAERQMRGMAELRSLTPAVEGKQPSAGGRFVWTIPVLIRTAYLIEHSVGVSLTRRVSSCSGALSCRYLDVLHGQNFHLLRHESDRLSNAQCAEKQVG